MAACVVSSSLATQRLPQDYKSTAPMFTHKRCEGPSAVVFLTALFCSLCSILVYPRLRDNSSMASAAHVLEPLQWTLGVGTLLFLALTNGVDPGTVTADMAPSGLDDDAEAAAETVTGVIVSLDGQRKRGFRRTIHNIEYRWCDTCTLWRPPRASHCTDCKRCFLRFDHHCPWVGTCVAQRNHRFFAGFLFCAGTAGASCTAALILQCINAGVSATFVGVPSAGFIGLALLICCSGWCFGSLGLFGLATCCGLACDVTTKDIKGFGAQPAGPGTRAAAGRVFPLSPAQVPSKLRAGCTEVCCQPCEVRRH